MQIVILYPVFQLKQTIYTNKHEIFGIITDNNILILKGTDEGKIHNGSYLIFNEIKNLIEDYHIDTICG